MKRNIILSVLPLAPPKIAIVIALVHVVLLAAECVLVEVLGPALSEAGVFA